ncbi:MAG: hypothetical protein Q7U10_05020 [Thermodesulfovibrionia bacterium]|nr:hypothetical protein [Thermodesulfovibrionia bacterium]
MRKTLVSILSFLLVAGFGASAFAGHAADTGYEYTPKIVKAGKSNIDLSGSIRIRGDFRNDTIDMYSGTADQTANYDSRIRLLVKATVSPNTMGVIELESGLCSGTGDGESYGCPDGYDWGNGDTSEGTLGSYSEEYDFYQYGNTKPTAMTIRQAYIAHQRVVAGVLSGVKAGHILTKLGNGVFYNHSKFGDDAIVLWTTPQKGTEISLTMAKLGEGHDNAEGYNGGDYEYAGNDDNTAYTLGVTTAAAGMNLGMDVTYLDNQDFTYDLRNDWRDSAGLHLWNIGLRADTTVSGIKLYGDVEIQTGKAESNYRPGSSREEDRKFTGYAWLVGANLDVPNSPVSIGAEVGYGSGDKIADSYYSDGDYDDSQTGTKYEGFLTTIGTSGALGVRKTAFLYDDKVKNAACSLESSYTYGVSCSNAGIANTFYVNVGADADVTPALNASLDIFYLRAAKGVNIMGARETNGGPDRSKNLGVEVDAAATYQLDTNLVYFVEAGYMFAGSAYNVPKEDGNDGENHDADNPYGIRHGLTLEF